MQCNKDLLTFELGERRRVTVRVWINGTSEFTLTNPTWELRLGEVEASGACETQKDGAAYLLTAEIQPLQRRLYKLQFTFHVGTEIIKKTAGINVI